MNWFHAHKWGAVENRHQRCDGCGIVRTVECAHAWKTIREVTGEYVFGGGTAHRFIQQCTQCGKIERVDVA